MNLRPYLTNSVPIPRAKLYAATLSTRIDELAVLTEILACHHDRIVSMPRNEYFDAIVRYYLLCIKGETGSNSCDLVHSRFEAAAELCRLLIARALPTNST